MTQSSSTSNTDKTGNVAQTAQAHRPGQATRTGHSSRTRRVAVLAGGIGAAVLLAWATLAYAIGPAAQSGRRAGAFGLGAGGGAGQDAGQSADRGAGQTIRQRIAQRLAQLGLTPEQRKEVRETLQSHREEIRDLADKIQQTRETLRQAAEAQPPDDAVIHAAASKLGDLLADAAKMRAGITSEIGKELTPEQMSQLKQWRASRGQALRNRLWGGAETPEKAN